MKVLQTVKYFYPSQGGMETVVKNIVESINSQSSNFEFTVYANSNYQSLFRQKLIIENIIIIKEITPVIFKSQPLNVFYPSLTKLINESDIIHHHYPFPTLEIALLRNQKLLKSKRLIITWHANIESSRWRQLNKLYKPIVKKILDLSYKVIVTSPQLLEFSDILCDYRHKIEIIPLSFDNNLTTNIKFKEFPINRAFKLLFVGKLREYKGVNFLIEAVKDLEVELLIVGSGECESTLIKQVESLGIVQKIKFLKNLSNDELKQLYLDSDLFVLPSINEAEAFGVVQLEAMANGLPVINTKLKSGVPFVSLNGITGLTVKPSDSISLKEAISKIISNKTLYETFSLNSINRSKEFSLEKMGNSYLEIYNS